MIIGGIDTPGVVNEMIASGITKPGVVTPCVTACVAACVTTGITQPVCVTTLITGGITKPGSGYRAAHPLYEQAGVGTRWHSQAGVCHNVDHLLYRRTAVGVSTLLPVASLRHVMSPP